ncbi:MAG: hypothetical protein P1V97_23165, partial [Planctomycetota bacterium]|nr:hypothetical protein [Planctomycetota bacterium]
MNNDDHTEIFVNPASDPEQVLLREKAIELGYLSESEAGHAFDDYKAKGTGVNFGSFLLEAGMISLEQLGDLQSGMTSPGAVPEVTAEQLAEDTPMVDEATMLGSTAAPQGSPLEFDFAGDDSFGLDETMGGVAQELAPTPAPPPKKPEPEPFTVASSPAPAMGDQTMGGETMGGATMGGGLSLAPGQNIHPDNVPGKIVG